MPVVLEQQDTVARGDAQHRDHSDQRSERNDAVSREGREHTADQRRRKAEKDQARQPPAAERRVENEEDRGRNHNRRSKQILPRGLALLVLSQ